VLAIAASLVTGVHPGARACAAEAPRQITVIGDAIPRSLTGTPGDAARGREIAFDRDRGNCPICHVIPASDQNLHGDVGPSLEGVAGRLSEGQLRLRLVDGRRINPASIMPSYYRLEGLKRVAASYAGATILRADEIEDVLAFLMTLGPNGKG
jgi:sulfur-oxidizing protein SoxX